LIDSSGTQKFHIQQGLVDHVLIYTSRRSYSITVCRLEELDEVKQEQLWSNVPYILRNLQLPFWMVNNHLHSLKQEIALALARTCPVSLGGWIC
jgi:hypothetical protein